MKSLFISLMILVGSSQLMAQSENRIAQVDTLTWFGVDCTQMKLIGMTGSAEEIADKYFLAWNAVVAGEREKYDLAKFFHKSTVEYDLAWVSEINDKVDPSNLEGYGDQEISAREVAAHIQTYQVSGDGVGLVIVLENFNNLTEVGSMWVVFFDIGSKEVLLAKNMSAEPQGFGYRNFWVHTVYDVLKDMSKDYRKWVR